MPVSSQRLRYERVNAGSIDAFHSLVQDPHVRRYLMDGEILPIEWTRARIDDSTALFASRGVGLWLAYDAASGQLAGFCGFLAIDPLNPGPQLVYALFEAFAGRGYATEMAQAVIADARSNAGLTDIIAGVDEVNSASVRVLEKLGFVRTHATQGSFGNLLHYKLTA